ncbi:hypothetical protein ACIQ7D_35350 [Streptomyces sp. NPDC096310]|uniref:hypothetical protein n=1 Tax=Streptomyces sp. NPDC096310 TaxID=3366082 RepID=UPI0038221571
MVSGMKRMKVHSPAGAIFGRFGRPQNQALLEAIGNSRREAHSPRTPAQRVAFLTVTGPCVGGASGQ